MTKLVGLCISIGLLSAAISAALVRAQGRDYLVKGAAVLGGMVGTLLFIKIYDQYRR